MSQITSPAQEKAASNRHEGDGSHNDGSIEELLRALSVTTMDPTSAGEINLASLHVAFTSNAELMKMIDACTSLSLSLGDFAEEVVLTREALEHQLQLFGAENPGASYATDSNKDITTTSPGALDNNTDSVQSTSRPSAPTPHHMSDGQQTTTNAEDEDGFSAGNIQLW